MTPVRVLVAGLVVLLGVWCQLQGAALAEDTEMIVNGTPAPEGKYPWQVRIYSSMEDERGFCGGSIIASQWVLTASHCLAKGEAHGGPNTAVDPADDMDASAAYRCSLVGTLVERALQCAARR